MELPTQTHRGAVLITGASGGLGTVTTRRLDALGFQVFAGVRQTADGERLQHDISARIIPILLDITDPASIAQAAETVTGGGWEGRTRRAGE